MRERLYRYCLLQLDVASDGMGMNSILVISEALLVLLVGYVVEEVNESWNCRD